MLSLDDERWTTIKGGYRVPYDPRKALMRLESEEDPTEAWEELWNELHHQGDVDEASYACVPHLARIQRKRRFLDHNVYGLVSCIELRRREPQNPSVPDWLETDYHKALLDLAEMACEELPGAEDEDAVICMLGIIALAKGLKAAGKVLLDFDEAEREEMADIFFT